MTDNRICIKYEGGDADHHAVEMRTLANSLLGFERIISDGLILLGNGRTPKRGERHELTVKVREPEAGSSIIPIDLSTAAGLLPLGWWLLQIGAGHVITTWMNLVFARLSGQSVKANAILETLLRMREVEARERVETHRLSLAMHPEMILGVVDRLSPAAIRAVAPIGPCVDKLRVIGRSERTMPVDLPVADAIRSKGELEITDLQRIDLRVDGFVHHSRKLNVENPGVGGRIHLG